MFYVLEWIHIQALIQIWCVAKSSSKNCFKDQTKVQHPVAKRDEQRKKTIDLIDEEVVGGDIRHSLMIERISSSLADNQISPLYDDDRDEESCVTCVFQCFTLIERLKIE